MRQEVLKLAKRWDDFNYKMCYDEDYPEADEEDLEKYSALMVESFPLIKDAWEKEMVPKDVAILLIAVGELFTKMDEEGNAMGDEMCERITTFHEFFLNALRYKQSLNFDKDGKLILLGYEDAYEFTVDPATFELPSMDVIIGDDDEYDDKYDDEDDDE